MKKRLDGKTAGTSRIVTRVTVTFQPTEAANKLLALAERANLNRSELLNTLIENHLSALLKSQIADIEEAVRELKLISA